MEINQSIRIPVKDRDLSIRDQTKKKKHGIMQKCIDSLDLDNTQHFRYQVSEVYMCGINNCLSRVSLRK